MSKAKIYCKDKNQRVIKISNMYFNYPSPYLSRLASFIFENDWGLPLTHTIFSWKVFQFVFVFVIVLLSQLQVTFYTFNVGRTRKQPKFRICIYRRPDNENDVTIMEADLQHLIKGHIKNDYVVIFQILCFLIYFVVIRQFTGCIIINRCPSVRPSVFNMLYIFLKTL